MMNWRMDGCMADGWLMMIEMENDFSVGFAVSDSVLTIGSCFSVAGLNFFIVCIFLAKIHCLQFPDILPDDHFLK